MKNVLDFLQWWFHENDGMTSFVTELELQMITSLVLVT